MNWAVGGKGSRVRSRLPPDHRLIAAAHRTVPLANDPCEGERPMFRADRAGPARRALFSGGLAYYSLDTGKVETITGTP